MSIQAHVDSLAAKRAELKTRITEEMNHPLPNFALITQLKKQNLAMKEEMQRYLIMLGQRRTQASSS